MSTTIYRKYRPQYFKDLVNQNHIKITLTSEIETDRIVHAYLFSGPRGIGKTTTARLLAKALNCQKRKKGQAEPCNDCTSCKEIKEGRSLDLIEIDAASHTGVDNVRENIINSARVAPATGPYKIYIIDEVHMLSLSAFNALLKTLEEPPDHVLFILATTEVHKVPETIISRCQRFDFQKVNSKDIVERLAKIAQAEKIKIDSRVLEIIALSSEGSIRDAESVLGQIFSLGEKEITEAIAELVIPRSDIGLVIALLKNLADSNTSAAIESVNKLVEEGINLRQFTKSIIEVIRKMILLKVASSLDEFSNLAFDSKLNQEINNLIERVELKKLIIWINTFLEKESFFKTNPEIIQLPLELAVLEIIEPMEEQAEFSPPVKKISFATNKKIEENKKISLPKSNQIEAEKKSTKESSQKIITVIEVKNKWIKFLKNVRKDNSSLALTLQVCEILSVENNEIILGFGYQFYQDRVWEKKNKDTVERILKETFGIPLKFKCTVQEELRGKLVGKFHKEKDDTEDVLKQALNTFGGELIEGK